MPATLDFECPVCGMQVLDRLAPAGTPAPLCTVDLVPMVILWRSRSASAGFLRPVTFTDDDGTTHTFHSVEAIHAFERRTEAEVRSGLRKRPFVLREFSQDHSNFDRNVFQALHPQVPREKLLVTRRGKRVVSAGANVAPEFRVEEEED